jgi:hypothetical protein
VVLPTCLGPISVSGFKDNPKINLETLQQDGGFGNLDALLYEGTELKEKSLYIDSARSIINEFLLVTTEDLIKGFLKSSTLKSELSKVEGDFLVGKVADFFTSNVYFGELNVKAMGGDNWNRAFLIEVTQDEGGYPNYLMTVSKMGKLVFILYSPLKESELNIEKLSTTCPRKFPIIDSQRKLEVKQYLDCARVLVSKQNPNSELSQKLEFNLKRISSSLVPK